MKNRHIFVSEHLTPKQAAKRTKAIFKTMKNVLSDLIIALSDDKSKETLLAAAKMAQPSLKMIHLYTNVRAQQKEMFKTYQHIKSNFSGGISTLMVSITAALSEIPNNRTFVAQVGKIITKQLTFSYQLINAIKGNHEDKVRIGYFAFYFHF